MTLRAFGPDGKEVDFQGALDPRTPLAQGWLRASHRKLDPEKSAPPVPALPRPRRGTTAGARQDLPPRDRDLAHLYRPARRASPRADNRRTRLRPPGRRTGRRAAGLSRIRPVPARRSRGPASRRVQRHDHHSHRPRHPQPPAAADHPSTENRFHPRIRTTIRRLGPAAWQARDLRPWKTRSGESHQVTSPWRMRRQPATCASSYPPRRQPELRVPSLGFATTGIRAAVQDAKKLQPFIPNGRWCTRLSGL